MSKKCIPALKNANSAADIAKAIANIENPVEARRIQNQLLEVVMKSLPKERHWLHSVSHTFSNLRGKTKDIFSKLGESVSLSTFTNTSKSDGIASWENSVFKSEQSLVAKIEEMILVDKFVIPNIDPENQTEYKRKLAKSIAEKFFVFKDAYHNKVKSDKLTSVDPLKEPLAFLYQMDGKDIIPNLPDQVIFGLMMSIDSWIATEGRGKPFSNARERRAFLYGSAETPLSAAEEIEVASLGHLRNNVVGGLGVDATQMLKIMMSRGKTHNPVNSLLFSNLETALGGMALLIGEEAYSSLFKEKKSRFTLNFDLHKFKLDGDTSNQSRTFNTGDAAYFVKVTDRYSGVADDTTYKQFQEIKKLLAEDNKQYYDAIRIYEAISDTVDLNKGLPLQEPKKNVAKIKRVWRKAPKFIKKTIQKLQNVVWGKTSIFDTTMDLLLDENSHSEVLRLAGVVDTSKMLPEEAASVEASNADKIEALRNLIEFDSNNWLDKFYIEYGIMNQHRLMQLGKVNPQNSHITRNLVRAHKTQVYDSSNINWFKLAVVFNMQKSPDKLTSAEVLQTFDTLLNDPVVKRAMKAFKEGNNKDKGKAIGALMDAGFDADLSILAGIVALNQYQEFTKTGKAFESDIPLEIDGISNGFAMALMQFPFYNHDNGELLKKLNQVGSFTEAQRLNNSNMDQYLKSIDDLYTELAQAVIDYQGKDGSIDNLAALFPSKLAYKDSATKTITKGLRNLVKYPSIIFMYGGGISRISKESADELITDLHNEIAELRIKYQALIDTAFGELETQQKEIDYERKKLTEESNVLAEDVQSAQNELDKKTKLLNSLVEGNNLYPSRLQEVKDAQEKLDLANKANEAAAKKLANKEKILNSKEAELEIQFKELDNKKSVIENRAKDIDTALSKWVPGATPVQNYLKDGRQIPNLRKPDENGDTKFVTGLSSDLYERYDFALEKVLGPVAEGRTAINEAVEFIHIVFTKLLEEKIAAFEEKHGYTPTTDTLREMANNELRAFFPDYSGPLDVGNEVSVDLTTKKVDTTEESRVQITTKKWQKTTLPNRTIKFVSPGVKPVIRQILNIDASTQASTLNAYPEVLTLYDAIWGNPAMMLEIGQWYSSEYLRLSGEINLSRIALDKLSSVWGLIEKRIKEENASLPEDLAGASQEQLNKMGDLLAGSIKSAWIASRASHTGDRIATLDQLVSRLQNTLKQNADAKDIFAETYRDLHSVQMGANDMRNVGPYQQTSLEFEVDKDLENLDGISTENMTDDSLGSMKEIEKTNIAPNTSILDGKSGTEITIGNLQAILEAFKNISRKYYESDTAHQEHTKYLEDLTSIMKPALSALGKIDLKISDIDNWTHGHANPTKGSAEVFIDRNPPASLLRQSPEEVYVHELGHLLITEALADNPKLAAEVRKLRHEIKQYIDANGKHKAFLQENPSEADIQVAKEIYKYLFANPDNTKNELAEFMMYGLTNRSMIQVLSQQKTPSFHKDGDLLIDKLINKLAELFDHLVRLIKGKTKNSSYDDLLDIAVNIVAVQTKHAGIYEKLSAQTGNLMSKSNNYLKDKADALHTKLNAQVNNPLLRIPVSLYGLGTLYLSEQKQIQRLRELYRKRFGNKVLTDLMDELRNGALTDQLLLLMMRSKKEISKNRQESETAYLEHFKTLLPNISSEAERALTDVIFKADLSALVEVGLSVKDIKNLINNPKEIDERQQQIAKSLNSADYARAKEWMNELAYYITNGVATKRLGYDNATQIVLGLFNKSRISKEAIANVDAYVTLEALKQIPESISTVKGELTTEVITDLISEHTQYKIDMVNDIFGGQTYEFKKGYLNKRTDHLHNTRIGLAEDAAHMKKLGFNMQINLGPIPGVNLKNGKLQDTIMYIGKNVPTPRLFAGIASFTGVRPGFKLDLHKLNLSDDKIDMKSIRNIERQLANIQDNNTRYPVNLRPIRRMSQDKKTNKIKYGIVGFRVVIPDNVEEKFLQPDLQFRDVMAHMKSNHLDQVNTLTVNNEMIDALLKEKRVMYNDNPDMFTDILSDSNIAHFELLPKPTKDKIISLATQEGEKKVFYVRKNILDKVIGYEEKRLTDTALGKRWADEVNHPVLHHYTNLFNYVARQIIGEAINKIVIATYDVIGGNMASNLFNLTILQGNNPVTVSKKIIEGYKEYRRYSKDAMDLHKIEEQIKKNKLKSNSPEAKKAKSLRIRLKNNKIHYLEEYGVNTLIVEDINESSKDGYYARSINFLAKKDIANKIPKGLLEVAQWNYLSSVSKPFQMLKHFVTMNDFLARYTMVEIAVDKAKAKGGNIEEARRSELISAIKTFVYFDENMNPNLQLINDMGAAWFVKYWMRNQRSSIFLAKNYPANVLAAAGVQHTTGIETLANINSSFIGMDVLPSMWNQVDAAETVLNPVYLIDQ